MDARPDELLEEAGRAAWRHRLALAWTDSLEGPSAKACSRSGAANWKKAAPLSGDEGAAVGFFTARARKRNPAVAAGASGLVIVEADLDVPDDAYPPLDEVQARVATLFERLELRFPRSVVVHSRRGLHFYLTPEPGCAPAKIQLAEANDEQSDTVVFSADGYTVGVPGLHELPGVVYEYVRDGEIAQLPASVYRRLVELGDATRTEARRRFEAGEPIPKGHRNEQLFTIALELVRAGRPRQEIRERLLEVNRTQCRPPLDAKLVEKQLDGAAVWARKHPTETERARAEARRVLDEQRAPTGSRRTSTSSGLWLPFVDVQLSGPPKWLWRRKIPVRAVTLVAGRPKLGKSLFGVWLAAQLSRGLLEGSYHEQPAKTLIIAAEDPPDPIVKGRLIAAAADENLVGTLVTKSDQGRQDRQRSSRDGLGGLDGLDGVGTYARRITIPDEYGLLEQIVVENEIALVVLDPINSFITKSVNAHRDTEIRRVLDPLAALAARRSFSALAVVHLNRRSDTDILNRITGSGGYGGSARSILTFGRHPENSEQRVIAAEGNWQKEAQSELFELREVIVFPNAAPDEQTQPALVHIGVTDLESSDLIDQFEDDRPALEEAKDYLLGELAGGPVPVADLRRGAEANGLSWRTVERAKKLLGVEARRVSSATAPRGAGRWEWFLELVADEENTDA